MLLHTVFMLLAVVCFFVDAIGVPVPRVRLCSMGLFFWALAVLIVRAA